MILPVILSLLYGTLAVSSQEQGESCTFPNGNTGVCTLLRSCQVVYRELSAGNEPEKICGWAGFDPVVCCPTTAPTPAPTIATPSTEDLPGDGRGEIARRKCAEYAKYVFVTKYAPSLNGNKRPTNVSECAIRIQKLIVGGVKAERKEFPHMVAIGYNIDDGTIGWYCGGTLISEKFVLTAAHCSFSSSWGYASWVRAGDLNLVRSDDGATPVERAIAERIKHPDYKPPSQYHDIALFRLETRVPFNGWIRPACLSTSPSTGTSKAIATGWGRVDWADDEGSMDLQKVTLPLVSQQVCNASYTTGTTDIKLRNGIVGEWSICAGEPKKDTCQGDSGGPLVVFSKREHCMYDIIGVTSLGRLCGGTTPGIYCRVYHYVPWIESIVWPQG